MGRSILILAFIIMALAGCGKQETQREIDEQLIKEYIQENDLDALSTPTGLHYVIEAPGNDDHPDLSSTVKVIYTGWLLDGAQFDSSDGNVVTFKLSDLIPGWQEGIPLFGKGGKGVLIVPSHLGYGSRFIPGIPPNSVLVFEMELVDFN